MDWRLCIASFDPPIPMISSSAWRLLQSKALVNVLQHRERRQDRVLGTLNDQTAFYALLGRVPPLLFLATHRPSPPTIQVPGWFPSRPSSFPQKLKGATILPPAVAGEKIRAFDLLEPALGIPLTTSRNPPAVPERRWAQSMAKSATYRKEELGTSPKRWHRSISPSLPNRNLSKSTKHRASKDLVVRVTPTLAKRTNETKGKKVLLRWQEKRVPLLRQAKERKQTLREDRPQPFVAKSTSARIPPLLSREETKKSGTGSEWIGLPYHSLRGGSAPSLRGPVYGPRLVAGGTARLRFQALPQSYHRHDASRLFAKDATKERARYAVRSERQQDAAEERHGEAELAARMARRFRNTGRRSDRPYRAIRAGQLQLGRRPRPFLASRTRPLRRRDARSQSIQREASRLMGASKGQRGVNRRRLPTWSRYLLSQDPPVAQARRRWWRHWHRLDPSLYGELRRAGSRFRERAGRRNLGWWRSLVGVPLDTRPLQFANRRTSAKERHHLARINRYPSEAPIWRDRRAVPLGWASRLYDPSLLQRVLARDLQGRPDPRLPYWSVIPRANQTSLLLAPFTLLWLYAAWKIRSKAYESVQGDFLRARETILRRGGIRERDPEWRGWLLEALGISKASAGIRSYSPGRRSLSRYLAGLRRDLPTLTERLWYLRTARRLAPKSSRPPRPTLLVGAPGTGKTSLVRVLADEAGVPVVYQCLAAFTDAGARFTAFGFGRTVAPQAVQRGFSEARRRGPSILFLDEIDALGAHREGRTGDQVLGLGQLLVEIDNADKNRGLVLFAATNRPEGLDPALVRPGRFDRTVSVPLPNRSKRISILKLYAGRLNRPTKVDWEYLAARTLGASAAHLASLTNTAALSTILKGGASLTDASFEAGLERILDQGSPSPMPRIAAYGVRFPQRFSWLSAKHPPVAYPTQAYQRQRETWDSFLFYLLGYTSEWFLLQTVSDRPEYWTSAQHQPHLRQATRIAQQLLLQPQSQRRIRKIQAREFTKDASLRTYAQEARRGLEIPTTLGKLAKATSETSDWPNDWYSFEIAEVPGFRSVTWVPPELHLQETPSSPGASPAYRRYLFQLAIQWQLSQLEEKRAEWDLITAELKKKGIWVGRGSNPRPTG